MKIKYTSFSYKKSSAALKKLGLLGFFTLLLANSSVLYAQEISPYLFGQNLWLSNGSEGRPGYIDELWPRVEQSGARIIRIGGAGYDNNLPHIDTLTKWVKAIKAIGAEPLLQVSKFESAQKAADLVKYFNKDHDLRISFWSIGNEPFHMDKYPVDSIKAYIKSHASAMKKVDPTIKIMVADCASYYDEVYEALLFKEGDVAGRDENGNWYIDGINFHNYPNADKYNRSDVIFNSVSKIRGMILRMKEDIKIANEKHQRTGENELIWGLTEFNITYRNPEDLSIEGIAVPSFINGQFWAEVFFLGMEYEAFTITPWCIQESDRTQTYFGYIGAPPEFILHSTFHHMELMARYMKGTFIKMKTSNPYLKAFATRSDGNLSIMLMNQDTEKELNFDFSRINKSEPGNRVSLSSGITLRADLKGSISPQSTKVFVFNAMGVLQEQVEYTLGMVQKNLPPQKI